MENGNRSFIISPDHVHDALDKLIQVSPYYSPNPLYYLVLVDLHLTTQSHLPPILENRHRALNSILTAAITERYAYHRRMLNLKVIQHDATRETALITIAEEGQLASVELLCWSWLYYHFVRVDLDIRYSTYYSTAHVDKRTLTRYQQHGIQRLAEHLHEREEVARKEQRKRWLYTQLPGVAFAQLIGRDDLLRHASALLQNAQPAHIHIDGAVGIGKSAFIGRLVKAQIDVQGVNRLVWIDCPLSVAYVRECLCEQLLPPQSGISLREYLGLQRVIVVLDDIKYLENEMEALKGLLDELHAAQVVLSSRSYNILPHCTHLHVKELSKESIYTILDRLSEEEARSLSDERASFIWERVGGNPAAAILMFQQWSFFGTTPTAVNEVLEHVYVNLEYDLKRAWLTFALLPQMPQTIEKIMQIWPSAMSEALLLHLMCQHMLEAVDSEKGLTCFLPATGRRFIDDRYESDGEMQGILRELIGELEGNFTKIPQQALDAVEHILLLYPILLEDSVRAKWILTFCDEGLRRGHCAQWRSIMEPYVQMENAFAVKLGTKYGICLRRVSQWSQAEEIFERVSRETGRSGLFLEQAYALLEWSILLEHKGDYDKALMFLARIESAVSRYQDEALLLALRMEQVQVALDAGDVGRAEAIVRTLPETLRTIVMWCEILHLKQETRSLELFWRKSEKSFQNHPQYLARMHVVLGQSYHQRLDLRLASDHFCTALTLLENQDDLFGAARIRANLGAVLVEQGAYREARNLLEEAEQTQTHLGDQVGLAVTRHNIQLLNRKVVR